MDGQLQQLSAPVHQPKIHTPGIKADAVEPARLSKPDMNLFHQRRHIPSQMAVPLYRPVLKAVDLAGVQPPVLKGRLDGAATGGAEVKGEDRPPAHLTTPFLSRMFA